MTRLVTNKGDLLPGFPRHYIRLLPTGDPTASEEHPDNATMYLRNLSGPNAFPARNIVDGVSWSWCGTASVRRGSS